MMIIGVAALAGKISRARNTPSYYSLSGYIAASDVRFCSGMTTAVTVYTAVSETSFGAAYSNSRVIYSDTALTTQADSGIYADTAGGSRGQTSYTWVKAVGWENSDVCP